MLGFFVLVFRMMIMMEWRCEQNFVLSPNGFISSVLCCCVLWKEYCPLLVSAYVSVSVCIFVFKQYFLFYPISLMFASMSVNIYLVLSYFFFLNTELILLLTPLVHIIFILTKISLSILFNFFIRSYLFSFRLFPDDLLLHLFLLHFNGALVG